MLKECGEEKFARNIAETIISRMGLIPISDVIIKEIEITEKEIASLIFNYGNYSFFMDLRIYIVYGIRPGKMKRIGKLIVSKENHLEIKR